MAEYEKLNIEVMSKNRTFTDFIVEGLSVEEMNWILDPQNDGTTREDRLVETLNKHNPTLGTSWSCGYGIYGINHFGGHLIVKVGNTCD